MWFWISSLIFPRFSLGFAWIFPRCSLAFPAVFLEFSLEFPPTFAPFRLHFGSILESFWLHLAPLGGSRGGDAKRLRNSSLFESIWTPFWRQFWSKACTFYHENLTVFLIGFSRHVVSILASFFPPNFIQNQLRAEKGGFSKMSVSLTRELHFRGSGVSKSLQKPSQN